MQNFVMYCDCTVACFSFQFFFFEVVFSKVVIAITNISVCVFDANQNLTLYFILASFSSLDYFVFFSLQMTIIIIIAGDAPYTICH